MAEPLSTPYNQIWAYDRWHTYQAKLTSADVQQSTPYHDFDLGVNIDAIEGHWYYGKIEVADLMFSANRLETFYGNGIVSAQLGMYGKGSKEAVWKAYATNSGVWHAYKIFRLVPATGYVVAGVNLSATVRIRIFDLTKMFGVGNEPSTVAEVKTAFPDLDKRSPFKPYRIGTTNA